jgi:hypothetical protein
MDGWRYGGPDPDADADGLKDPSDEHRLLMYVHVHGAGFHFYLLLISFFSVVAVVFTPLSLPPLHVLPWQEQSL